MEPKGTKRVSRIRMCAVLKRLRESKSVPATPLVAQDAITKVDTVVQDSSEKSDIAASDYLDSSSSSDESEDDFFLPEPSGTKTNVFKKKSLNQSGWRMKNICAMILYIAKSSGMSDKTLGKLLSVFALLANTERHENDANIQFPASYHRLKCFLNITPEEHQKVIYICPATSTGRKKGELEKMEERCGFHLTTTETDATYKCEACKSTWPKEILQRDGNHFVTVPISKLLHNQMSRFGKYTEPTVTSTVQNSSPVLNDVTDGLRFREMNLEPTDLAILMHSDGAVMSKSTTKKLYFTFVQCVNIPLKKRLPVWSLQSVWVGDDLVKDRECFLVEQSRQLMELQPGKPEYIPVVWYDKFGQRHSSHAYVLAVLADSPERTALSGQLPHSARQGCPYCLQVAETISHRICYKYIENVEMKSHAQVIKQAQQWETSSHKERKARLDNCDTNGFKRPSVMQSWKKFDMIKGFCLDVMHQFDEGVSKYLIEQLIEEGTVLNIGRKTRLEVDRKFLDIAVTGHNNRDVRSLKKYKNFKAHEFRFFIQHAAPYVTMDLVSKSAYKVFCLASRIAHTCTKDNISPNDTLDLKALCSRFMLAFQEAFGVSEMKYSIHLVSHLWYAVELYGPLHIVSCYGPEDQIGRIARKITGMNNTTKHIMNNFIIYTEAAFLLDILNSEHDVTDSRVLDTLRRVQGARLCDFTSYNTEGTCQMLDRPIEMTDAEVAVFNIQSGLTVRSGQAFRFKRAKTEGGIFIRTHDHPRKTQRNETVVVNDHNVVLCILELIAVVNLDEMDLPEIVGTYVVGRVYSETEDYGKIPRLGTKSVIVPHVFCVRRSNDIIVCKTAEVSRQMVILLQDHFDHTMLVSPPSNQFRPT